MSWTLRAPLELKSARQRVGQVALVFEMSRNWIGAENGSDQGRPPHNPRSTRFAVPGSRLASARGSLGGGYWKSFTLSRTGESIWPHMPLLLAALDWLRKPELADSSLGPKALMRLARSSPLVPERV